MGFLIFVLILAIVYLYSRQRKMNLELKDSLDLLEKDLRQIRVKLYKMEQMKDVDASPQQDQTEVRSDEESRPEVHGVEEPPPVPDFEELQQEEVLSPPVETELPPVLSSPPPVPVFAQGMEKSHSTEPDKPAGLQADTLPNRSISAKLKVKPEPEWKTQWNHFRKNVDWELFTGTRLFAWLGVLALFIGAVFFIKLSIEKNWIPPALRLAIGAVAGISLILFAWRFKKTSFTVMRHTLTAGGVGVLYTVVFTATLYYSYLSTPMGFVLLTLISGAAFVLAVYHRGISISVLGVTGAYATPLMLDTGTRSLWLLFIYLAVVNIGLYKVAKRLSSPVLLFVGSLGTMITLGLGVIDSLNRTGGGLIAGIWSANLLLFTGFLWFHNSDPEKRDSAKWNAVLLYGSSILVALLLIFEKSGWSPMLLLTAGVTGSLTLGYLRKNWSFLVVPYGVLSFCTAVFWVLTRFDASGFSVSYVFIFLYGASSSLGPVLLIHRHGQIPSLIRWLKAYPLAISALCLGALYQNPECSYFFWPLMLGLQIIGIGISLVLRAIFQIFLLIVFFVLGGLFWMVHIPASGMGFSFFAFILIAGGIFTAMIIFAVSKLPQILEALNLHTVSNPDSGTFEKWLMAIPTAGVYILIGAAFMVQHPHYPHPGMVTLFCFLIISLFFCRRIAFEPPGMIALFSAVVAQSVWILNPENGASIYVAAMTWSFFLFIAALVSPFIFFNNRQKWKMLWNSFAVYEALQALFVFFAVKHFWNDSLSNWTPLVMVFFKLPVVIILLKRLEGKPHRNSILAFHGGTLLLYVSMLPVFILSRGWIGLALVFEALALLWLNRRIPHPGLRRTALVMAPAGLLWLLVALPGLKTVTSLPVLNPATLALAAAVLALALSVKQADFPQRRLWKLDLPNFFKWLALGAGFYLLNAMIADFFAAPGVRYHLIPERDFLQTAVYALGWSVFGAILWRGKSIPDMMKYTGFTILAAGASLLIVLPVILPESVVTMSPLINKGLFVYLILAGILFISYWKEPWGHRDGVFKNIFLALFLLSLFMLVKLEKNTLFQPGYHFTFFLGFTISKAIASACGTMIYGTAMLIWHKRLDRPFRIAGLVLILSGIVKSIILPFKFAEEFGRMNAMLNTPTAMYVFVLIVLIFLVARQWNQSWPFPAFRASAFFGLILAITSFLILNIEIAACFGRHGEIFRLATQGNWTKLFAYSIGWLVFSIGLLSAGIRFKEPWSRRAAMVLLVITAGKVFVRDLASLEQLYRVGSFIGLAFVLILVSFLYQKFLSEDEKNDNEVHDE